MKLKMRIKMKLTGLKTTMRVAKIELNTMFYSPVAWLVLIVFTLQMGIVFAELLNNQLQLQEMGHSLWKISSRVFTDIGGVLTQLPRTIYLYIPLVTMGLMSREYQSGSIKLLYSSPVKNWAIIGGKFVSMIIYGLMLIAILAVFVVIAVFAIDNFDYSMVLAGMLGIYLLILADCAVGLFMSSITKYQVVAAIGTLSVLALLDLIGGIGQDYDVIRNITYWLSLPEKAYPFINGLIASNNVIYFLIVIAFFLALAITKLNLEKMSVSLKMKCLRYGVIVVCAFILGYISSIPRFKYYYDATYTKSNTLSKNSQKIMSELDGGLTITTYVNVLDEFFTTGIPRNMNNDMKRFEKYCWCKPEIKMKYVYYYDKVYNPDLERRFPDKTDKERMEILCRANNLNLKRVLTPEKIREKIDLSSEGNRFVRVIERENGQKTFLRLFNDNMKYPEEAEISAALKRFVSPAPVVAFSTGYGSREIDNYGGRGYYLFAKDRGFRQSIINNGFDTRNVNLDLESLDSTIDILVISDLREPLSDVAERKVQEYVDKGGNLFVLGEYGCGNNMNKITSKWGVLFSDGVLVNENGNASPTVLAGCFTSRAGEIYPMFDLMVKYRYQIALPTTLAIDYSHVQDFDVLPILVSHKDSWLEKQTTDFVDGDFTYNPELGEKRGEYPVFVALSRKVGMKEQRIIISGDSDVISNECLTSGYEGIKALNYNLVTGSFLWLSNGEFPVDVTKATDIDSRVTLPKGSNVWINWFCKGIFPFAILFFGMVTIIRRQRK